METMRSILMDFLKIRGLLEPFKGLNWALIATALPLFAWFRVLGLGIRD